MELVHLSNFYSLEISDMYTVYFIKPAPHHPPKSLLELLLYPCPNFMSLFID